MPVNTNTVARPNWATLDSAYETLEGNPLAGRDLLRLLDLTPTELHAVLSTAAAQKTAWFADSRSEIAKMPYSDKAVAIILEKPSLRTRISFEIGVKRLGAHPVVMSDTNSAFSRGESIKDTIQVLERFVDAIVIRSFAQSKVAEIAHWARIPIVNALTDDFHPCQGLGDLLTMFEHKGDLSKLKVAYVGDGNNMAHTYIDAAALIGFRLHVATPEGYEVNKEIVEASRKFAARHTTGEDPAPFIIDHNWGAALKDADVVITDTWTSMGDEDEASARQIAFAGYTIDEKAMALAAPDAIFMHCLPAHRGEEVTDEVMDGAQSAIYDEAENRLHVQKALLSLLMAQ